MRNLLLLLVWSLTLAGCGKQSVNHAASATNDMTAGQFATLFNQEKQRADAWFAGLADAQKSAPDVVEFVRLFPAAKVNFRYFTDTGVPGFDVSADLYGRYEFQMQLPVVFDSAGRNVVGYGEPRFYLNEVSGVLRPKVGVPGISYDPLGHRQFGADDWKKIVISGGDFRTIGYLMKSNQPVEGFRVRTGPE
jgi:hypothetical protein